MRGTSRLMPVLVVSALAVCGCGSSAPDKADAPRARAGGGAARTTPTNTRRALHAYLRVWETSWWHLGSDLGGGDEDAEFSDTPDASWDRARRYYESAATAYRHAKRRLSALRPPRSMRAAHHEYLAAVGRQEARFQTLADAFAGTDPYALERALEALERSQLRFDFDGVRWEQAVVSACKAARVAVPEIVRRELVSNGQRTKIQ